MIRCGATGHPLVPSPPPERLKRGLLRRLRPCHRRDPQPRRWCWASSTIDWSNVGTTPACTARATSRQTLIISASPIVTITANVRPTLKSKCVFNDGESKNAPLIDGLQFTTPCYAGRQADCSRSHFAAASRDSTTTVSGRMRWPYRTPVRSANTDVVR
jgi:hypothetical protein